MGELPNGPISDPHVQIGDHRLSISCAVVERPDHHCGDDLVEICWWQNYELSSLTLVFPVPPSNLMLIFGP